MNIHYKDDILLRMLTMVFTLFNAKTDQIVILQDYCKLHFPF